MKKKKFCKLKRKLLEYEIRNERKLQANMIEIVINQSEFITDEASYEKAYEKFRRVLENNVESFVELW